MFRSIFNYFPVVMIVTLFYGLVMIPGTFRHHLDTPAQAVNESVCVMAFSTGDFAAPEIVSWADLNAPTLFALPDYRHGFSSAMDYRLSPVHTAIPVISPGAVPVIPPDMPAASFAPIRLSPPAVDTDEIGVSLRREETDGRVIAPKTMLWMWGNGAMIEAPPAINGRLKEMDTAKVNPTAETQVDIINDGGTLRMLLYQSSGSPELDQAVLLALGPALSIAETLDPSAPRFLGEDLPLGRRRVRVEWRTLPEFNRE
ncbi:MAG: hypothetical protein RRC34_03345 [Lentisphaeria bacterium]|nr:hypothetical protein [Lentisphaeria bacterium]